jgi:hypothetical protein
MRQSISNPRVVLGFLLVVAPIWAVAWAYLDRPRVQVGWGALGGGVDIRQSDLSVDIRSTRYCGEFEKRLGSAQFPARLAAANPQLAPLFPQDTPAVTKLPVFPVNAPSGAYPVPTSLTSPIASGAKAGGIVFMIGDAGRSDLAVVYFQFRQYRVTEPPNQWIAWLQSWLPGMPDKTVLAAQADEKNQPVKAAIESQVRRCAEDAASSIRPRSD